MVGTSPPPILSHIYALRNRMKIMMMMMIMVKPEGNELDNGKYVLEVVVMEEVDDDAEI